MSWLYSRVLVEEYLEESSSGGVPFVQSNETNTPQAYLYSDKTTDTWNPSRFGVTCEPLTESRGEDVLTWFLEGFPVKTYPAQETAQESKVNARDSGWRWPESSARYDPGSSSWRTRHCSPLGGLEQFSETWPRWGTMRNGESWERTMPEHLTSGTESGSLVKMWPTPCASDNRDRGNLSTPAIQRRIQNGKQIMLSMCVDHNSGALNPPWVEWLMGWPEGWTSSKPLETDRFQLWLQPHLKS